MALIKLGGGVSDIRGSIGGTVFSKNRYGSYTRNRTIPVNPGSSYQTKVRAAISTCRNLWFNTLTAANRAAWDTYAANVQVQNRLGETINLTGWNMFCRSAMAMLYNDLTPVAAGPTEFSLPDQDETLTVSASESTGLISVSFDTGKDWVDEDDAYLLVYASREQNPTINYFKGPYRLAGKIDGDSVSPPSSPQTVTAPFAVTENNKVFVMCRILRADGRLSEPFRASCTIGS